MDLRDGGREGGRRLNAWVLHPATTHLNFLVMVWLDCVLWLRQFWQYTEQWGETYPLHSRYNVDTIPAVRLVDHHHESENVCCHDITDTDVVCCLGLRTGQVVWLVMLSCACLNGWVLVDSLLYWLPDNSESESCVHTAPRPWLCSAYHIWWLTLFCWVKLHLTFLWR